MPNALTARTARRRLWQLISPSSPVGAYSFSAGLEWAIHAGWLRTREDVFDWVRAQLLEVFPCVDLPAQQGMYLAMASGDDAEVEQWNLWLRACRETAELRREDAAMAQALARLLVSLEVAGAGKWREREDTTWSTVWILAGRHWQIPLEDLLEGGLWSWCENQVAAAIKLLPLGQSDGQRLLLALGDVLPEAMSRRIDVASIPGAVARGQLGMGLPGVVFSSMCHETQYSRLFRS